MTTQRQFDQIVDLVAKIQRIDEGVDTSSITHWLTEVSTNLEDEGVIDRTSSQKVNELLDFVSKQEILYACDSKTKVKILIRASYGAYVVRFEDHRPDQEFMQPLQAIKCYEENGGRLI